MSLVLFFAMFGASPLGALALLHFLGDDIAALRAQAPLPAGKALS